MNGTNATLRAIHKEYGELLRDLQAQVRDHLGTGTGYHAYGLREAIRFVKARRSVIWKQLRVTKAD